MNTHKLLRSRAAGYLRPNRTRWLLLGLLTGLLAACGPRAGAELPVTPTARLLVDSTATVSPPPATTPLLVDSIATMPPLSATVTPLSATMSPPAATAVVGDGPGGCVLGATFLGDSSPPSGAVVAPGVNLIKSWRVRNDGTCPWTDNYALVFIGGDQLGATAGRIPPTQPGAEDLLSMRLHAPAAAGTYSSVWQLRASNGAAFGQIAIPIRVVALPTALPTPMPSTAVPLAPISVATSIPSSTPTPDGSLAGCAPKMTLIDDVTVPSGTTVSPHTRFVKIWRVRNDGTCAWSAGYTLLFTNGEQMGAASETSVPATLPGQEVDLTLTLDAPRVQGLHSGTWQIQASNGALFGPLEVSINVVAGTSPTPVPTVDPNNLWSGTWASDCGAFNCGTMSLVQSADWVSGTFGTTGTLIGTANGSQLEGDWVQNGDTGSFALTLAGDGQSWVGTLSPGSRWCGWRAGTPRPDVCVP